jgi:hypothetical protein
MFGSLAAGQIAKRLPFTRIPPIDMGQLLPKLPLHILSPPVVEQQGVFVCSYAMSFLSSDHEAIPVGLKLWGERSGHRCDNTGEGVFQQRKEIR